jgi:hypothetical protein
MPLNRHILAKYLNPYFVETGTLKGEGVKSALAAGFPKVISIELSGALYAENRERFKDDPRVDLRLGDSGRVLAEVIEGIDSPITFWLDAHMNGLGQKPFELIHDNSTMGEQPTAALAELEAIARHPVKTHTILIDDIRNFKPGNYETPLQQVIDAVMRINPTYKIEYIDSWKGEVKRSSIKDILVARVG